MKGFKNIKLVFPLFKVNEPLKFEMSGSASVQVKCKIQSRPFFSHAKQNEKMGHIGHNGIVSVSKISNFFPIIQSQLALKIPNVLILLQYR